MTRRRASRSSKQDQAAFAVRVAQFGDLRTAKTAFIEAVAADRHNPGLHYNLGLVHEQLGEIAEAVVAYTRTLRHDPGMQQAARRLRGLLARYRLADVRLLDPFGLKAALTFPGLARQPLVEAALAYAFATNAALGQALAEAQDGRAVEAARSLLLGRPADRIADDLMLAALSLGVVRDLHQERLFTALRSVLLLECPPERFWERPLAAFALALLGQAQANAHVWIETADETAAHERPTIVPDALLAGDLDMARLLILKTLYRPTAEILPAGLAPERAMSIRPKPLRDTIVERLAAETQEQAIAAALPRLSPLADPVSQRVAAHYEKNPYPRWQSLQVTSPEALRRTLSQFFPEPRLDFMDRPFDILFAGAGTGQHALQAAFAYGPQARFFATDVSARSLAYAERMAGICQAPKIEFQIADILDLHRLERTFDIVECIGVLHHMADPWAGWRALIERLAPQGLLYIGLYSATSRRALKELRSDPAYPGPDCSDAAARVFRVDLMGRNEGQAGSDLVRSQNFYSLPEFRDLVLHPHEQHVTIPDIERFLAEHGLAFRGFTLPMDVTIQFARATPGTTWPGKLAEWARFEEAHPRTFDGMYTFWCERQP
ncbi:MAG: methyltransferase [Hyphomicrobiaceae bacterium]